MARWYAIAPARFETRRNAVLAERAASEVDELDTGGLGQMAKAFGDELETFWRAGNAEDLFG
jgi:hypothetical protein